ncbi:DUF6428 family protein [Reichenbachiella carrageenanivorans]|uniref:DUF6428 family protein n=1 Tax=Reichenbachiella carrageenanivorans TaxID=2979869 RepID=A0ABY6D1I4_9BACT|nr:DUF6428 family protein [Reichenbachiella carrageenanivorans]UXX80017.1 DUF6428 family protein [Reichenbachiella carrageenanivorans]
MKTSELLTLLKGNPEMGLVFEIESGQFVKPTFHITEVKNVTVESVDCGGNPDTYKETIIQLMVNPLEKMRKPWTAQKALDIFEKVGQLKPMDDDAEVFFEYGDLTMRTSNFSVENVIFNEDNIHFELFAKPTVCKPSLNPNAKQCC